MRASRSLIALSLFWFALFGIAFSLRSDGPRGNSPASADIRLDTLCFASAENPMGRGCYSWHGGECGCQGGRDVCCDGTLSPTCTCHQARPADTNDGLMSYI